MSEPKVDKNLGAFLRPRRPPRGAHGMSDGAERDVEEHVEDIRRRWSLWIRLPEEFPVGADLDFLLSQIERLREERDRLRVSLHYWLPDETMIPEGHEEECSGCNPDCPMCEGPGLALGSGAFRCRNCGWTWIKEGA